MRREIDDIFGECLRRERRLAVDPWDKCSKDEREHQRERSAHIRRMLRACGLELTRVTDLERPKIDDRPMIQGFQHVPNPAMSSTIQFNQDDGTYSVMVNTGNSVTEMVRFEMRDMLLLVDGILRRDPAAQKHLMKPGNLSALAAYAEVLRMHPVGAEA